MGSKISNESINSSNQCLAAIKSNDIQSFGANFPFIDIEDPKFNYILSYKLILTLCDSKQQYFLLVERITDFDNKFIRFIFEVEAAFSIGNRKKLMELKGRFPEFDPQIDVLIHSEFRRTVNEIIVEPVRVIERIHECLFVLENYDKI